jgi:hypothetical protein
LRDSEFLSPLHTLTIESYKHPFLSPRLLKQLQMQGGAPIVRWVPGAVRGSSRSW